MRRESTMIATLALALVLLGLLMVYSATENSAVLQGRFSRQCVFALLGVGLMLFAARFDYHRLADPVILRSLVLLSLILLLLVHVPGVGREVDGGKRWIGSSYLAFQPSEFAKFTLVLLLAAKLAANRDHVHKFWRGFVPPMIVALLFAGLVLIQRDLGFPVIMLAVAYLMLGVAGVRMRYLAASAGLAMLALIPLIQFFPHRMTRLIAFINPWEYRLDEGWQLIQSYAAFARGGFTGVGAGAGEQKLGYLPAPHTDFIFAALAEEFGLVGSSIVVMLFGAFLWGGLKIATHAQDLFGSLLALGITALICLQAGFIIGVNTGLLPTKGLPLPLISYGGTALLVSLGMVGVLINIGVQAREPEPERNKLIPAT